MKKSIIIFSTVLLTITLTAFGFKNWNTTATDMKEITCNKAVVSDSNFENSVNKRTALDLVYKVESRFITTITKERLHNAKSIIDILPEKATKSIVTYYSARVSILEDERELDQYETEYSEVLNAAQIKLLQSADYSTNIYIRSDYIKKNKEIGYLEDSYLTYYITIIPEKEAEYTNGHAALIEYLKENSKKETAIIKQDQLQPGKVNFTITKEGTIANVKLMSTSGYTSVDKFLVELVNNIPGKWNAAMNSNGDKVDQELVFFFGLEGC